MSLPHIILGMLRKRPKSGYDLKKRAGKRNPLFLGGGHQPDLPILKSDERKGLGRL